MFYKLLRFMGLSKDIINLSVYKLALFIHVEEDILKLSHFKFYMRYIAFSNFNTLTSKYICGTELKIIL